MTTILKKLSRTWSRQARIPIMWNRKAVMMIRNPDKTTAANLLTIPIPRIRLTIQNRMKAARQTTATTPSCPISKSAKQGSRSVKIFLKTRSGTLSRKSRRPGTEQSGSRPKKANTTLKEAIRNAATNAKKITAGTVRYAIPTSSRHHAMKNLQTPSGTTAEKRELSRRLLTEMSFRLQQKNLFSAKPPQNALLSAIQVLYGLKMYARLLPQDRLPARQSQQTPSGTMTAKTENLRRPGTEKHGVRQLTHQVIVKPLEHAHMSAPTPITQKTAARPVFPTQKLQPARRNQQTPSGMMTVQTALTRRPGAVQAAGVLRILQATAPALASVNINVIQLTLGKTTVV